MRNGKIDILIFSAVVKEGIDIYSNSQIIRNLDNREETEKLQINIEGDIVFYRTSDFELWKKVQKFKEEPTLITFKLDMNFIPYMNGTETIFIRNQTNPVKHFINMGTKWDHRSWLQSIGRCIRGNSHPLHIGIDGNISQYPRGFLYVHNIFVCNPYRIPGEPIPLHTTAHDVLTPDERKERREG